MSAIDDPTSYDYMRPKEAEFRKLWQLSAASISGSGIGPAEKEVSIKKACKDGNTIECIHARVLKVRGFI